MNNNKQTIEIECKFCGTKNIFPLTGDRLQEFHFACWDCDQPQTSSIKLMSWNEPSFKKEDWYITPIVKETPSKKP